MEQNPGFEALLAQKAKNDRDSDRIAGFVITARIDPAPLGWRFWTLAGFPADPIEPRPYGGSRCFPLVMIDVGGTPRWLCAMKLDHTFRLYSRHDLFPCSAQDGAETFARDFLERHARQSRLL
ncbi:transposase (plasmid) [Sphingomonas panacis]|uniref:Transposase n=1 Tax=Sphingomonas panacis TaxID=1560345 RepID=A0A1B3ZIQ7_9SPHN|nr:transposase [Sphingomonas panacis]